MENKWPVRKKTKTTRFPGKRGRASRQGNKIKREEKEEERRNSKPLGKGLFCFEVMQLIARRIVQESGGPRRKVQKVVRASVFSWPQTKKLNNKDLFNPPLTG